jgi:hypothetical protein
MSFSQNLSEISNKDLILRSGTCRSVYLLNEGWNIDFSLTVNLVTGTVLVDSDWLPKTFWEAISTHLDEYHDFEFMIMCDNNIVLCEYDKEDEEDHPLTGILTNELALQIFTEAVAIINKADWVPPKVFQG